MYLGSIFLPSIRTPTRQVNRNSLLQPTIVSTALLQTQIMALTIRYYYQIYYCAHCPPLFLQPHWLQGGETENVTKNITSPQRGCLISFCKAGFKWRSPDNVGRRSISVAGNYFLPKTPIKQYKAQSFPPRASRFAHQTIWVLNHLLTD